MVIATASVAVTAGAECSRLASAFAFCASEYRSLWNAHVTGDLAQTDDPGCVRGFDLLPSVGGDALQSGENIMLKRDLEKILQSTTQPPLTENQAT
jgi:hypothetical protein